VRGLTVTYGSTLALEDISLDAPAGASIAVLGPNGAGKSTLLQSIAGLVEVPRGAVTRDGNRGVAYLPQSLAVEPSFPATVADIVEMGRWGDLGPLRRLGPEDRERVRQAIEEMGLAGVAERRIGEVSGGERRRALLAQVIAQDAALILLDEPFTDIDRPTADSARALIRRWAAEGRTVMVATHDLERAATEYDLVLALNRRLVAFGPPSEVCTEECLRETFSGHVVRLGESLFDTAHHHHGAS